jgi:hypothetical protein
MNAHIVDALADTTPIEHLDFEPPCEDPHCDHAAIWILWRVRCCPTAPSHILVCDHHRRLIWALPWGICLFCNKQTFIPCRSAFYRCEPLKQTGGDT